MRLTTRQVGLSRAAAAAAGVVVLAIYFAHVGSFWNQVNDDAYITFRYSKFLTLGHGPVFNPGERVEGYSNFLLMLMIAGVIVLFGDGAAAPAAKAIGVAGGAAALIAAWALCRRWLVKIAPTRSAASMLGWMAALLAGLDYGFALNSTTGLETTLFAAWITLGVWAHQAGRDDCRWRGCGVFFALAVLTRPEGALAFGAIVLIRAMVGELREHRARRALLLDAAIVAGVGIGQLAFRLAFYDGELLPNTYYAKSGGLSTRTGADYIARFLIVNLGLLVGVLAFAPLAARRAQAVRASPAALAIVVAALIGTLKTGADWMLGSRLLVPYLPLWGALAVFGLAAVTDRLGWRRGWVTGLLGLLMAAGIFAWQWDGRQMNLEQVQGRAKGYHEGHEALAAWLLRESKAGQTVALMDIGIVGYRCMNLRVLDTSGLTDRFIAKSAGPFLTKQYDPAYVLDQKPDFVVIVLTAPQRPGGFHLHELTSWTPIEMALQTHPRFRIDYTRLRKSEPLDSALVGVSKYAGAETAFEHPGHPGFHYFLAVYRRHQME